MQSGRNQAYRKLFEALVDGDCWTLRCLVRLLVDLVRWRSSHRCLPSLQTITEWLLILSQPRSILALSPPTHQSVQVLTESSVKPPPSVFLITSSRPKAMSKSMPPGLIDIIRACRCYGNCSRPATFCGTREITRMADSTQSEASNTLYHDRLDTDKSRCKIRLGDASLCSQSSLCPT